MPSKTLVTGSGGFIGSRLTKRLREKRGGAVDLLGLLDPDYRAWHLVDVCSEDDGFVRAAMNDKAAREKAIADFSPEVMIHLYAFGLDRVGADDPLAYSVNERLTLELAEFFFENGGRRFVTAGSFFEYGENTSLDLIKEDHACFPATTYAKSKVNATNRLLALAKERGREAVVLRPFQVYGPAENPHRFMPTMILAAIDGREATFTSGTQQRDFVHVDDVAAAFAAAAEKPFEAGTGVFNIATGVATTLRGAGETLEKVMGEKLDLRWGEREALGFDISALIGDGTALHETFGWTPRYSLEEGLKDSVAWYREHRALYEDLPPRKQWDASAWPPAEE